VTLERLSLSRSTLDRAAHRRTVPALIPALLADPATAVVVLDGEQGLVVDGGGDPPARLGSGPQLALLDPAAAAAVADPSTALAAFLGQDGTGRAHLLLAAPAPGGRGKAAIAAPGDRDDGGLEPPAGTRWAGLREVGSLLDDTGAGLLTTSVALAHWHAAHPRCSRCGEPTGVIQAGWARGCPACGAEHYPRTDPAVIMAVVDGDDRLLLGRQASWPPRRFSTLAGFVEPGESLEAAVRREVLEEAGVVVGEVVYRGSQPWPFPSSLMLGFAARARSAAVTVDGEEVAEARWWTREELALDLATGELLLPPTVSIARRLIEDWYGGAIHDAGEAWR
jgi:NAD+ diphosphatase